MFISSGIDLDGNTVGIAYLGTMCNYDSSVGVTQVSVLIISALLQYHYMYTITKYYCFVQDTRSSVASVATIAAHEMGHTFGLNHDDAQSMF